MNENAVKAAAGINLLAGTWLFVSPWVYRAYSEPNAWNSWIVGFLIALFAIIRMSSPATTRGASIANLLLGIWTFASPWIYRYTGDHGMFVNSLCVGIIVFVAGVVASTMGHTMGHPSEPPPLRT